MTTEERDVLQYEIRVLRAELREVQRIAGENFVCVQLLHDALEYSLKGCEIAYMAAQGSTETELAALRLARVRHALEYVTEKL